MTVSISTTTGELGNFNPDNGNTQAKTVTVTVSTNAYSGYVVRMYALDFLRSIDNPPVIIPDFSAGTYASPAERSGTGWGSNTDDGHLNGGAFWTGAGCTRNPKYAPISQTGAGDVVGHHTATITGATGPVVSAALVITLRATTNTTQKNSDYATDLIFGVVRITNKGQTLSCSSLTRTRLGSRTAIVLQYV